jgi:hypothetical protein
MLFYSILNYFFFVFHTVLILFNLFGYIPKRTRRWNLVTLSLTFFSWFILGIWYGWGFCFCTEWHWEVRRHLGFADNDSYTHFLIHTLTGINPSQRLANVITANLFFFSFSFSIILNLNDRRKNR